MGQFAIIENGLVVNIAESDKALDPSWKAVKSGAGIGWSYTGGKFEKPVDPPIDPLAEIASRRYQEETKGITVNGVTVKTDRQSQALITGAALAATIDPAYVCRWKSEQGFITLDAPAIIGVATAIRNHVQGCFDREADLVAAVDAGTFTAEMLGQGWPGMAL